MKRYIRASFNNDTAPDWLKKDKYALQALNKAGIDLANCTFSKDRVGKVGENYTAYLIKGTKYGDNYRPFVWIPGVYNDDEYVDAEPEYSYRLGSRVPRSTSIKYMAKKDLTIEDVVYINIASNRKPAKEHYQDPRYDKDGQYAGQYYTPEKTDAYNSETGKWDKTVPGHWSEAGQTTYTSGRYGRRQKRDKSGYVIPDPQERLRKFHETEEGQTRQAQKASRELETIYDQLTNLKDKLTEDFNANAGSLDTFGKNSKAIDYFKDALDAYKQALSFITPKTFGGKEYSDPENALEYIERAKTRIRYAEKSLETGVDYSSNW